MPTFRWFWGIFSTNDVIYRCNDQKSLPCAETRRLSHKAWISVQRFDLGAGLRKKDKTVKKVTKALYFTYLGRSPHWTDFHKNLHVVAVPDVITCAHFWAEIFMGYDFTGVEFPVFLLLFSWALQQCSATALAVIYSSVNVLNCQFHCEVTWSFEAATTDPDNLMWMTVRVLQPIDCISICIVCYCSIDWSI